MKQSDMFGAAKWVCAAYNEKIDAASSDKAAAPLFSILRSRFKVKNVKKAVLRVVGLGFFYCYLNGNKVSEDCFLPLNTDFELRKDYPVNETVTGHRLYVPEYDVTSLIKEGENVLAVHYGGGWYTFGCDSGAGSFGDAKAIYRLMIETADGEFEVLSSENDRIGESYISNYNLAEYEIQDFRGFDDACFGLNFDDIGWKYAAAAKPVDTCYDFSDCPADRTAEELKPVCSGAAEDGKCYDSGKNCSAVPVLRLPAVEGEAVTVLFAEERCEDGSPDMNFSYGQKAVFISDGRGRVVQPEFTWFGFRYFKIIGNAEVLSVKVIHTDIKINSSFDSDSETLNWIYRAYLNTQLSNMHAGIPSDCPHIERRGYTGDGQLTCHAVMNMMDARAFYAKWIKDIGDCQDIYTGHIQYTAPYTHCGGGPGGWGSAIVEVPYRYYMHYGDIEPARRLYPQMLRYFDYLESHSTDNIVVRDKDGEWCLGDWCAPDHIIIPAGFVNNYFYIRSLEKAIEIASLIGRETDIPMLKMKIEARKRVVKAAYFNNWDGNYVGNIQGANAFALDIGLGDNRTYANMVKYYTELGRFDTGIFGTELVSRLLFERGDGELAVRLLISENPISYDAMRKAGATTLWENWPNAVWDRSRNHPMFGAVTAYFFDYLLGIRTKEGKPGYPEIIIAPVMTSAIGRISGSRTLPAGEVKVSYEKKDGSAEFCIVIPENLPSEFILGENRIELHAGENRFKCRL